MVKYINTVPSNSSVFGRSENIHTANRQNVLCIIQGYYIISVSDLILKKTNFAGLDTEGLFRKSANTATLKQVQKDFNEGKFKSKHSNKPDEINLSVSNVCCVC